MAVHETVGVGVCDVLEQWKQFFDGMPDKNAPVLIKFDIDAREHEGRYFNSVQAWDISITQW